MKILRIASLALLAMSVTTASQVFAEMQPVNDVRVTQTLSLGSQLSKERPTWFKHISFSNGEISCNYDVFKKYVPGSARDPHPNELILENKEELNHCPILMRIEYLQPSGQACFRVKLTDVHYSRFVTQALLSEGSVYNVHGGCNPNADFRRGR